MAENTKIEWATHTFNPWVGCTKIRDTKSGEPSACDFCYAEAWGKRSGMVQWGNHPRRRTSEANWKKPLKWAKAAEGADVHERPRVFCSSLADVFDNQAPQEWRYDLFMLIEATPELDWLLLTKRPQNINKMIPEHWQSGLPDNVWTGVTAETQRQYDRRLDALADVRSRIHFISYEPALGPLSIYHPKGWPNWIICGGEDRVRPGREMDLQWARDVRDQCRGAGISFFFKQTNGKGDIPADLIVRELPHNHLPRSTRRKP